MLYHLWLTTQDWLRARGLDSYFMVLDQVLFRAIMSGLLAFALVLIFGKPVVRWLASKKIGDAARFDVKALDEALKSKQNTPTMGGLLIAGSILVSTLLMADLSITYVQIALVVVASFACIGAVDDWLKLTAKSRGSASRQGLFAWEKLVFQLGIALLVGVFAHRAGMNPDGMGGGDSLAHAINLPFQKTYNSVQGVIAPGVMYLGVWLYAGVMILALTGMSNAVNITDGMDGLATGITMVIAVAMTALCVVAGSDSLSHQLLVPNVAASEELAVVGAALAGACMGFLWWNCSPAMVFMGDTGSLCLGATLGYIAVVIRQEFVFLVMSGVFLLEIFSVVLQVGYFKWTKGKRIFRCAPYHWHLHMGGWTEQKIVVRLWIVTIVLVGIGLATLKVR